MAKTNEPDRILIYRLSAEAVCHPRTAARALRGDTVKPLTLVRLTKAADALGVRLPAQPSPKANRTMNGT
jgi:hypothetical protein